EPEASWFFDHGDANSGALHLRPGPGKQAHQHKQSAPGQTAGRSDGLTLDARGRVGVGEQTPDWPLDVAGVIRSHGRIGLHSENIPCVAADGRWKDITQPMTGCQKFEVVAGVGGPEGEGRYSMLHAIAMNAYNPRNRLMNWFFKRRSIRAQTAMYGSYADRLRLKWEPVDRKKRQYKLRIRTNAKFSGDAQIRYTLTRLWFDTAMSGSRPGGAGRDGDLL
ncbi:MAG: hypothetical protein OXD48_12405, partial [Litoreibacter sp.]|nr:hypothetical protein [Litoreibacter sp.]